MSTEKKPTISRYGHEITSKDGFLLPLGTINERLAAPKQGYLRAVKELGRLEHHNGSGWEFLKNDLTFMPVKATSFTAAKNKAYPVNTVSTSVIVDTPANPNAGDRFSLVDSSGTWHVRSVTVRPSNGQRVERSVERKLDVKNDHVVFVFTGIPDLGWVRENGGYPLVPVYAAINLKAAQVYVDDLPNQPTHPSASLLPNTEKTILAFPPRTLGFKTIIHVVRDDGDTELFEVIATKNSVDEPVFTLSNELRTIATDVTFTVIYEGGLKLQVTGGQASTIRTKVLWNIQE